MNKVEVSGANFQHYLLQINKINSLLSNIEKETGFHSNPKFMYEHEGYIELVNMGDRIVNYLMHVLMSKGGSWIILSLLHSILKINPIPDEFAGRFPHAIKYWLTWYCDSDYYKNNDVYHNLINNELE